MILENVFVTEIQLDNGTEMEFVDKGWYALNVHKEYPDEVIGTDAFLDWARDLSWIKQKQILIVIRGIVTNETKELIKFIDEYWKDVFQNSKKDYLRKKVDFIIAD